MTKYFRLKFVLAFAILLVGNINLCLSADIDATVSVIMEDWIKDVSLPGASDDDNNDINVTVDFHSEGPSLNQANKVVMSITSRTGGITITDALYVINPCDTQAKIQVRKFEDDCTVDGTDSVIVNSGEKVLLTSSYLQNGFSNQCSETSLINTSSGVICAPNTTYAVIECLSSGTIDTNGGVIPYADFFYLDPLGDGTGGGNDNDDIYATKTNNRSLYNIYVGHPDDPIVPEGSDMYTAWFLNGEAGVSANCDFTSDSNGNACRDAISAAIQTRRTNNWENDPGVGGNISTYRFTDGHGLDFDPPDVSGYAFGVDGSGNFVNPIYASEALCLADQNQGSYTPPTCGGDMVTVWSITSTAGDNATISLPLEDGYTYNFTVDWGDGNTGTVTAWDDTDKEHTYGSVGNYTVTISGTLQSWRFYNGGDKDKLIQVTNLGDLGWTRLNGAFYGCTNLTSFAGGNTPNVLDMQYMFAGATSVTNADVSCLNTSNVTNMDAMFKETSSLTSLDLSNFNTSNVTSMRHMFDLANSLTFLDVSSFNTSSVTNMIYMFKSTESLATLEVCPHFQTTNVTSMQGMFRGIGNSTLDVSCLVTSNVVNMSYMFNSARNLTSLNLSTFNTSSATSMASMFKTADKLETLDLSGWNTSSVTSMNNMFYSTKKLESLNLAHFDTTNVTNMGSMFKDTYELDSLDISGFNTSKVTSMTSMFYRAKDLVTLNFPVTFTTSNVTSMYEMFGYMNELTALDVSTFDTSKVTSMAHMFRSIPKITALNVSNFDTEDVTDMTMMFYSLPLVTTLNVSGFNTSNVINMTNMFQMCGSLTVLDVSNFNTSNVANMHSMFHGVDDITVLDVSGFNTDNVTKMNYMFYDIDSVTSLDVRSFDTSNVINMQAMFGATQALTTLLMSNSFDTSNVTNMSHMFQFTGLTSLDLSGFDTANVTTVEDMFWDSSLTDLNAHNWDIGNVINSDDVFYSKDPALVVHCDQDPGPGLGTLFGETCN